MMTCNDKGDLIAKKDPNFSAHYQQNICDILLCAGLIHDIGNPPFGHYGETAIREWFRKNIPLVKLGKSTLSELLSPQMQTDLFNFEGNAQALRVTTKLHYLIDENGMNLTKALLGTIIKYPISSLEINENSGDIRTKKMGYFYADTATFENVQKSLGTNGRRHPLSFILEAADDIAYLTADVDDAFRKEFFSYIELTNELQIASKKANAPGEFSEYAEWLILRKEIAELRGEKNTELYAVQNWVHSMQSILLDATAHCFIEHYEEIMAGEYKKELLVGSSAEYLANFLRDLSHRLVHTSRPIMKLEITEDKIICNLLDLFVDAVVAYDTKYHMTEIQKRVVSLIPVCRRKK